MPPHRPVVLIGFDGCDPGVVSRLAQAGRLPTFRRLLDEWASAAVPSPPGFYVTSVWTSFSTARPGVVDGFHCWEGVERATYVRRPLSPRGLVERPFWRALGDAGRRVAVLDVPHMHADGGVNGIEVFEYGCHDRHFGFHTSPPDLAKEIESRLGLHPALTVDPWASRHFAADDFIHRDRVHRTPDELSALARDMLEGLERKRRLSTELLAQGGWDLFLSIFGESHGIGHQAWHLHDPSHPSHDPSLARALGDPVADVYAGLDRALAAHLAIAGPDARILVLLSHGMGPHYDGTQLLEPVLTRLDAARRPGESRGAWIARRLRNRLAETGQEAGVRVHLARRRLMGLPPLPPRFEVDIGPARRASRRFFQSPNNTAFGGVRLNVVGREPRGLVRPGAEFDALCEQLRRDLLALVNVATGSPVVQAVERTDAHYERPPLDELPDLLVDWSRDALIETVWSPRTGTVHRPYLHWRTGDHRMGGRLFAAGPGIAPGADLGEIRPGDIGPTVAALLGVELPAFMDGTPLASLTPVGDPR
jgi:predicted AlkP superfamily phosphohydrolase/phosphomutase